MDNIQIVTNLVLWVFVIGLTVLVFALTRQIGVLYERVAPAGALMMNKLLETGAIAPKLEVEEFNSGAALTIGGRRDHSQLLFFLAPGCPVCKTLLPMVRSVKRAEADWLDLILASDGETAAHREFIEQQQLGGETYVLSERLGKQYGVSKLPYAVLIDNNGTIASLGLVNSREHFESLFESMERGVPSLQAYMAAASAPVTVSPQRA
jgi:methylamine dehydrogenase accessory protein MauD